MSEAFKVKVRPVDRSMPSDTGKSPVGDGDPFAAGYTERPVDMRDAWGKLLVPSPAMPPIDQEERRAMLARAVANAGRLVPLWATVRSAIDAGQCPIERSVLADVMASAHEMASLARLLLQEE